MSIEVATMEYSYEVREEVSRTVHGSEYAPIYRSLEAPLNVCFVLAACSTQALLSS